MLADCCMFCEEFFEVSGHAISAFMASSHLLSPSKAEHPSANTFELAIMVHCALVCVHSSVCFGMNSAEGGNKFWLLIKAE